MSDFFKKKLLVHDFATDADGDFLLANMNNYYNVTISVDAVGLDDVDSTIGFLERVDSSVTWKLLPGMTFAFATIPDDSQELVHGDFSGGDVGIRIAKTSCTTGVLTVWLIGKSG